MPKQVVRESLLLQRQQLPVEERLRLSHCVQAHLIAAPLFKGAHGIALYSPTRGEVDTLDLFAAARQAQKRVYFPRVDGKRMVFVEVAELASLAVGAFGVLEPPEGPGVAVAVLDLVIVPGVAFDRRGHRIGYGKGFYDRELHAADFSGASVGLCYQFQLCDRLPAEAHDIPMDYLLTEQGLFTPQRGVAAGGSR